MRSDPKGTPGRAWFLTVAAVSAVALASIALSACSPTPPAKDGETGPVKLVYGEQRNIQVVADASGTLKHTPYGFEWATFATPSVQFEAFRSGATDLASSNDITVLNALASGVHMKIVAAIEGSALQKGVGVITRRDSPVKTVADLKGRTVIVSSARGGSGDNVLRGALREARLEASDVQISYAPFTDAFTAFQTGSVETLVTNDPYLFLAEQQGGRIIRNGEGLNAGLVLIGASDAALADPAKRAAIGDLLGRLAAATQWGLANTDAYAAAYAKRNNVDATLARQVVLRNAGQLKPITPELVAKAQGVADAMLAHGYLQKPLVVAPFFDATVYRVP